MTIARSLIVAVLVLSSLEGAALAAPSDGKIEDVKFTDADTLTTGSLSPESSVVKGGPTTHRTILTRPRMSFVPELLASIQNL